MTAVSPLDAKISFFFKKNMCLLFLLVRTREKCAWNYNRVGYVYKEKKKGKYSNEKKKAQRTVGEAGEKAPLPRVAHLKKKKEPEL
jgi:hypothetical protein